MDMFILRLVSLSGELIITLLVHGNHTISEIKKFIENEKIEKYNN